MQSRDFRGRQEILSCLLVMAAWTLGVRGQKVGGECEGREGMRPGGMLSAPAMNMLGKWPNHRSRAWRKGRLDARWTGTIPEMAPPAQIFIPVVGGR